jgi:tetratricopeptide (TPR) repeat protein
MFLALSSISLIVLVVLCSGVVGQAAQRNILVLSWIEARAFSALPATLWKTPTVGGSQPPYVILAQRFDRLCDLSMHSEGQLCLMASEAAWLAVGDLERVYSVLEDLRHDRIRQTMFAIFAGDYLYVSGDTRSGIEIWRQYLPPALLLSRASFAVDREDFASASEILSDFDPEAPRTSDFERRNLVKVLGPLAMFALIQGRLSDSEFYWRWATRLSPESAIYYQGLGNALAAQNRLPEALAAIQTAVQLDPKGVLYYVDLAKVQLRMGMVEKAVTTLETAVRIDPRSVAAQDLLRSLAKD